MPPTPALQFLSSVLVTITLACSTSSALSSTSTAAALDPGVIVLERSSPDTLWQVTWRLPAPVNELRFERPAGGFRRDLISIVTPGYTIEREGEFEVLRTSGIPAREVTIRFPLFTRFLEREYEFFRVFSDGGVAIYTGHLVVRPVYSNGTGICDSCVMRSFEIKPPSGETVVIRGHRYTGPAKWHDETAKGTYVYIGPAAPLETPDMISVIDPGLPPWIVTRTRQALPQLFKFYRERFGIRLPIRPTILFDWGGDQSPGFTSGGGTLPGLVQLGIEGDGWIAESRTGLLQLFRFLSHESAHLWNGEVAAYRGVEDSWMHEGGADALAERTLLQLGLISEAGFLDYQTAALNECLFTIGNDGVRKAARRSAQIYYVCGNVIALLTESAINTTSTSRDLFDFWKELFSRAVVRDNTYDADDYYAALSAMGAPLDAVHNIKQIVEGVDANAIPRMLASQGVELVSVETPPESYGQSLSRKGLFSLLGDLCTGRFGFRPQRSGMLLDSGIRCTGLPSATTVKSIGGHDLLRAGHLAWDYMHARCGTADPLMMTIEDHRDSRLTLKEVKAVCKTPLKPRGSYFRVAGRPI